MKAQPLTVYLPDTRGVTIGRYGYGNRKIGNGVFTYSRLAGGETGTCPGATNECEAICYAKRISGPVRDVYAINSGTDEVPPIPEGATLLRLHISGDFDSVGYVRSWIARLTERPDVTCWAYTRSWRVPELLSALEELRALPNVQLFASMDPSCRELPPAGWRRAWIWRDVEKRTDVTTMSDPKVRHLIEWPMESRLAFVGSDHNQVVIDDGTPSYVCPEETGRKRDCVACGYCFEGQRHDVTFLEH